MDLMLHFINFQSSSEFKLYSLHRKNSKLGVFQSSSEFKQDLRTLPLINLHFQSSSEFKEVEQGEGLEVGLVFQSSSEFKLHLFLLKHLQLFSFNPLLSLRFIMLVYVGGQKAIFQSSSEFKDFCSCSLIACGIALSILF